MLGKYLLHGVPTSERSKSISNLRLARLPLTDVSCMVKSLGLWRTSTMSSFDKVSVTARAEGSSSVYGSHCTQVVKLACKPKAAPPKAKVCVLVIELVAAYSTGVAVP